MSRTHVNSFSTTLNEDLTAIETDIDVVDASGLGTITGGDFIPCTITDGTNFEIIHVTAVVTNTLTATRAQEGTTGITFTTGDIIECRPTAGSMDDKVSLTETQAIDFGAATSLEIPNSSAPAPTVQGRIALDTDDDLIKYGDGSNTLILKPKRNTMFYAYQNTSGQVITNNVVTKVTLDAENFDAGNYFDSATNYRYTPLIAGKYWFLGSLRTQSWVSESEMQIRIYKNGGAESQAYVYPSTSGNAYAQISTSIDMNGTTDYIELYIYQLTGGNVTVTNANTVTFLTGALVEE